MPEVSTDQAKPAKVLFMAKSGFGKTGACAALANAGYKVVHHDFDQGTRIINSYLSPEAKADRRYWVRHHTDKMRSTGMFILPDGVPTAYTSLVSDLRGFEELVDEIPPWAKDWEHGEDKDSGKLWLKFPSIEDFDDTWVNILDSFTFLGLCCMRYRIRMNVGLNDDNESIRRWQHPWPGDFGEAQDLLKNLLALLYADSVKCNILVLTHVQFIGGGGMQTVTDSKTGAISQREVDSDTLGDALPTAIGRALSPIMPRFFNTVISGEFEGRDRMIVTRDLPRFPLKNEAPLTIDQRLPISTGLAELFRGIRGV